jgi:hypothetical protein
LRLFPAHENAHASKRPIPSPAGAPRDHSIPNRRHRGGITGAARDAGYLLVTVNVPEPGLAVGLSPAVSSSTFAVLLIAIAVQLTVKARMHGTSTDPYIPTEGVRT